MHTERVIDHLVYATPDLEATVSDLRSNWGIDLVEGGPHVGRGTRNYLAGLGNGQYLEVIGPDHDQPAPLAPRPFGVDDIEFAQMITWCARPDRPLNDVVKAASLAGFDLGSVIAMSRKRPDGKLLEWELTVRPGPPHPIMPFCISWGATEHPTQTLTNSTLLTELMLTNEHPTLYNKCLAAIGETILVTEGSQSIQCVLTTPHGELILQAMNRKP
jgi:Glyoxalase-like domain